MSKIVFPSGAYMYVSCRTYRYGLLTMDVSDKVLSEFSKNDDGEFLAYDQYRVFFNLNLWRNGDRERRLYIEYHD